MSSAATTTSRQISESDRFFGAGLVCDYTVLDFWRYAFSHLNSNMIRGAVAEFIVETALRPGAGIAIRNPWGDFDVGYRGRRIEIKCCGYWQDYEGTKRVQAKQSPIEFSRLNQKYRTLMEHRPGTAEYKADLYILAALQNSQTDTDSFAVLNLDHWGFYVLSQARLRELATPAGNIRESKLKKGKVLFAQYVNLKSSVDEAIETLSSE